MSQNTKLLTKASWDPADVHATRLPRCSPCDG